MAYLAGLLSGFGARKREVEQENLRQADLAMAREAALYKLLLEQGTPEFQTMAAAGLLESATAPKRKGGLRGWLGEMEASPIHARIRELMGTPSQTEVPTFGLPSRAFTGYLPQRPATEAPLAQPETSPTEVGAPPLAAVSPAPTPVAAQVGAWEERAAPVTGTRTITKPRQIFRTPEEMDFEKTLAGGRARTAAEMERASAIGFSPEEYKALEQAKARRAGMGGSDRSIFGEILQPDGTWKSGSVVFDPQSGRHYDTETGQPVLDFRRNTTVGSISFGADREAISREPAFGGLPYAQQSPEGAARVNAEAIRRLNEQAYQRGTGAGQARIETELASPIGVTTGAAQGLDPTTPLGMLQGIIPVTSDQRERLAAMHALAPQVTTIRRLVARVFPAGGGPLVASKVIAQKRISRDPELMQLEAQINLALGNVARTLAAESGRLTEQDAQRARTALADLQGWADTQASALAKLDIVEAALRNIASGIRTPTQQMQERSRVGTTPAAAAGGTAQPVVAGTPSTFEDAQGNWQIRLP